MSISNPTATPPSSSASAISSRTHHIAGILTTIYGLNELPTPCTSICIIWLLHPRLQTAAYMGPVGTSFIHAWNARRKSSAASSQEGLIAVAFDQRNHGSREVDELANQSWKKGNPRHAQDMYGIFHGTAVDVGVLMEGLGNYVTEMQGEVGCVERHFVMGISLGGHAAWQVWLAEPRVEAAIVVIGCPDYMRVMSDRARNSKLETYKPDNGAHFLGSKDFPPALVASVQKWDPKGLLFGVGAINPNPSAEEQFRLRKILDAKIKGKAVLVCSGGADKLVPYRASAPFLDFLKRATKGWYSDGNVYVEDNVYEGVGHVYSEGMSIDACRFLCDAIEGKYLWSRNKTSIL